MWRAVVVALVIGSVALLAFAAWGMWTTTGRRRFDEMDGLYPMLAGALGAVMAAVAVVLAWVRRW